MIRYALKCAGNHVFESWFHSADSFEKLKGAGMVTCVECGSAEVAKLLMTPAVRASRQAVPEPSPRPLSGPAEAALARLRRRVEETSEYVGVNFTAEARAMHAGDAPERPIYGEARRDEAKKLVEDGIPVAPLPFLPTRKAN